ncbi:MAG: hypothetical protein A2289_04595 [Deltaproteobacteria bacterium RIFOXYA12_FULL_58_15]|nr:MAG: hypothetical protein A2289_04595 [Deltaproteobacteria bacterium RIFOXYA12_FULL_58_15]OGR08810.1 MAG: hypothetical protein A2341_10380 [Deltaproteobacteria bacterium RIFOXYB12_FULL_58_9]
MIPPQAKNAGAQVLRRATVEELEALYVGAGPVRIPRGYFIGSHLEQLEKSWRRPIIRFAEKVGFQWLPFGVDFDSRRWFFVKKSVQIGAFDACLQSSVWRNTQVVALHYQRSHLPKPIRRLLYDEVVPLGPDLCLGLGGVRVGGKPCEQFFFILERGGCHHRL